MSSGLLNIVVSSAAIRDVLRRVRSDKSDRVSSLLSVARGSHPRLLEQGAVAAMAVCDAVLFEALKAALRVS